MVQPALKQNIVLSLKPQRISQLAIMGLWYWLSYLVQAAIEQVNSDSTVFVSEKRLFKIHGPKLKNVNEARDFPVKNIFDARH